MRLPEWNQKIILEEISTKPVSSKVVVSQAEAPKVMSMEAMPSVLIALWLPRPNQSISKEKQKRPQLVLVRQSPRRNHVEVR